ncbi:MAG: hypothetical protein AAGA03_00355 [Planctomycetota bacterium]
MLLPIAYPLPDDFGKPLDDRGVRQRWATATRHRLMRRPVKAFLVLLGVQTFLGVIGWVLQRLLSPSSLYSHLARPMPFGNAHLGAEYYNIASAVARGDGFSDPFLAGTGATAWMPPLLVWIQAAFIWLFGGDRFLVMITIVSLKTLVLAGCGLAILSHFRSIRMRWLAFGSIGFYLASEFFYCFRNTHDSWLILGTVTSTLFGLAWIRQRSVEKLLTIRQCLVWGLVGGVTALSSPVAGFSWAVGTTCAMVRNQPKHWIIAGVTALVVILPWSVRNRVMLGKWIPIKSNVYFEFDQSQVLDSDGLLDGRTMSKHPIHANKEQRKYIRMGEIDYLETKKTRFWKSLQKSPEVYWSKVRNRLFAVTIYPAGFNMLWMGLLSFPLRIVAFPVPLFAMVILCTGNVVARRRLSSLQQSAIVLYIAYLFPYVICSYYPRYGVPLLAIKMLLMTWFLQRVLPKRFGFRKSESELRRS